MGSAHGRPGVRRDAGRAPHEREAGFKAYLRSPGDGRRAERIPAAPLLWALFMGVLLRCTAFAALEALVESRALRVRNQVHPSCRGRWSRLRASAPNSAVQMPLALSMERPCTREAIRASIFAGRTGRESESAQATALVSNCSGECSREYRTMACKFSGGVAGGTSQPVPTMCAFPAISWHLRDA